MGEVTLPDDGVAWHFGRAEARAQTHTQKKEKKNLSCFAFSVKKEQHSSFLSVRCLFVACTNGPPICCQSVTDKMCQTTPAPSSSFPRRARSCINPAASNHAWSLAKPCKITSLCESRSKACPLTQTFPMIRYHSRAGGMWNERGSGAKSPCSAKIKRRFGFGIRSFVDCFGRNQVQR